MTQYLPRKNELVLVAFEDGDTERPLILGSLYHLQHLPVFDLPSKRYQSGIQSKSRSKENPGHHQFIFDDHPHAPSVTLNSHRDFNQTIGGKQTTLMHADQLIKVDEHFLTEVQNGRYERKAVEILLKSGDNSIHITPYAVHLNAKQIHFDQGVNGVSSFPKNEQGKPLGLSVSSLNSQFFSL